jgi:hypothetical protein
VWSEAEDKYVEQYKHWNVGNTRVCGGSHCVVFNGDPNNRQPIINFLAEVTTYKNHKIMTLETYIKKQLSKNLVPKGTLYDSTQMLDSQFAKLHISSYSYWAESAVKSLTNANLLDDPVTAEYLLANFVERCGTTNLFSMLKLLSKELCISLRERGEGAIIRRYVEFWRSTPLVIELCTMRATEREDGLILLPEACFMIAALRELAHRGAIASMMEVAAQWLENAEIVPGGRALMPGPHMARMGVVEDFANPTINLPYDWARIVLEPIDDDDDTPLDFPGGHQTYFGRTTSRTTWSGLVADSTAGN